MVLPVPPVEYDYADAPVLTGEFRARLTNALTNPTTVVVKVRPPSGVVATYTAVSTPAVTNVSTGVYQLQLPAVTAVGDWFYRFEGTGDLIDNAEQRFTVLPSPFATPATLPTNQWLRGESLLTDPRLAQANMPPEVTLDMCAMSATETLYKRTGRRYRVRAITVVPNQTGCGCSIDDCYGTTEVDLPSPVVPGTVVVTIGGVVLSSTLYAVYSKRTLVRTDGLWWPICRHQGDPTGVSWSISLNYGMLPGMDGILACRELAIHVALALCGKQSKIPARAVSASRGGVTLGLSRGQKTGIALVDDYIEAENPNGLRGRGSVSSPDTIRLSRT